MPTLRSMPTAALALILVVGPFGCQDPQAQQQTAAVAALADATREFSRITVGTAIPGGDTFAERRSALARLATTVNGIQDPPEEPLAAKAQLAASIQRELAALALAEASALESELQRRRGVTREMVIAASRLQAIADARGSIDLDEPRADLGEARRFAEEHRAEFQAVLADLDEPIEAAVEANESDQAVVDELTREANALRREAQELGASAGFDTFEQAVDRERDADQLEVRIARRELDLDYELRPEHRIAQGEVGAAEELMAAVDISERGMDAFVAAIGNDVELTRRMVGELADRINARCAESRTMMEGDGEETLDAMYVRTQSHLQNASREAGKASRTLPRGEQGAARMAEARIHAMLGQANWIRAHGLDDQIDLLDAVLAAEDVVDDTGAFRDWRDALLGRRGEALDGTKAAYEQAKAAVAQVNAREGGPALIEFGQSLEAALAALSGEPMAMTLSLPTGAPTAERPATPAPTSGDAGARTHGELIARLEDAPDTLAGGLEVFRYCRAQTPAARRAMEAMVRVMTAMGRIDAAMTKQFGSGGFTDMVAGMSADAPDMDDLTLVSETEDTAVYRYDAPAGAPNEARLIRVDGSWYIDIESIVPGIEQMEPMMQQQVSAMETAAREMVPRIEAGEFGSAQEAMMAMMQYLAPPGGAGTPQRPR